MTGSALLARQSAYEAAGGWSRLFDFYMEDLDLCLRFRRRGQSVWLVPDAVVLHAVSATAGPAFKFKLFLFWRNRWIAACLLHWPWWRLFRMLPGQFRIERAAYRHRQGGWRPRRDGGPPAARLARRLGTAAEDSRRTTSPRRRHRVVEAAEPFSCRSRSSLSPRSSRAAGPGNQAARERPTMSRILICG